MKKINIQKSNKVIQKKLKLYNIFLKNFIYEKEEIELTIINEALSKYIYKICFQKKRLKILLIYKLNIYIKLLNKIYIPYKFINSKQIDEGSMFLTLNFTRDRFFPFLKNIKNHNYFMLSLGLFSKYIKKKKSFKKQKINYIVLSNFIRKILIFSKFKKLTLLIKKTPKYFYEILNTLNKPSIRLYQNPFLKNNIINEKKNKIEFFFYYTNVMFIDNKYYGTKKVKKKGRLKRKIQKRINKMNNVLD